MSSKRFYPEFGQFLAQGRDAIERKEDGRVVTQQEIANKLGEGRTQSAYAKYEAGSFQDIDPGLLRKLCDALGLNYFDAAMLLTKEKYGASDKEKGDSLAIAKWALIEKLVGYKSKVNLLLGVSNDVKSRLLVSEIRAKTAALQDDVVLDMEGLAEWERALEGENNFWIASENIIDSPGNAFFDAVCHQLKQGSRYTFFLPEQLTIDGESFSNLVSEIKKRDPDISGSIQCVGLTDKEISSICRGNAYVIANPTSTEKRTAFLCPLRNDGFRPTIAYLIDHPSSLVSVLRATATQKIKNPSDLKHITAP